MKKVLTLKILKEFLKNAANKLSGDWILIGGTVLPLLGIRSQPTVDIDLIPIEPQGNQTTLQLMTLAEELGLSAESINFSGAYFLEKILNQEKNYREHLLVLQKGKRATIYRPNALLYLQLKLARLSEKDLDDCLKMLTAEIHTLSKQQKKTLSSMLRKELKKSTHNERTERIKLLCLKLEEFL